MDLEDTQHVSWGIQYYGHKEGEIMTDLVLEILNLSRKNDIEGIETIIEKRLVYEPENTDLWLRLAIVELAPPISDYYKSIYSIEKALSVEKNNIIATLMLAYVNYHYLGGIDEKLLYKINSLKTDHNELNSMLKYATSWFYCAKNIKLQEAYLRESIDIYNGHVWNNYYLAKLSIADGRMDEGKLLIDRALKNVIKIYSIDSFEDDITNVDDFVKERIKGIYLTQENFQIIEKLNNL